MAALSLWVRRTWTRRWLGLLGLGLLIAVVGGITLAVTAGARRTASAFDRLQARSNAPTIQVELAQTDQATPDGYADLPTAATLAEQIDRVPGVNGVAVATFIGAAPEHSDTYFAAGVAASRGEAPHDRLLAGRLPGRDQPDEVVINEPAVAAWHTGLGQTLRIHTLAHDQMATFVGEESEDPSGPVIDAKVVGISRGAEDISDLPEPIFFAGPAFLQRWGAQIAEVTGVALVNADRHRIDEVVQSLNERLDPRLVASPAVDRDDFASRIRDTIDVEVAVLTVFAVAAALAGLIVVSQALARTLGDHGPEQERLGALGMTRSQATMGMMGALAPALLVGLIGSVTIAVVLSPLFPRGLARRAEGEPGLRIDGPVVVVGAVSLLVVLIALAGTTAWRAARAGGVHRGRIEDARPRHAARLPSALPPVPSLGTRFALERGPRRRTVEGLAGIVGAAVLVGGLVGVAAVERSRHHLLATSALYGARWDYEVAVEDPDADAVVAALARERDVQAVGTRSRLQANGGDLDVRGPSGSVIADPVAYRALKGSMGPVVTHGQRPGSGETAIGRRLGRRLGVTIGDTVVVKGRRGDVSLAVTGWFINPGQDDLDLGILVSDDTLHALAPQDCDPSGDQAACGITTEGAGVVLRPGASRPTVLERLQEIAPDLGPVGPPSVIENLAEVGATPWFLAGFLALIGGAGLAHALIVGVRRRRYDLAVVRALGLRPGQARHVVTWEAGVMAAIGAALGLVVGLLAGRLIWERVATGTGAIVRVQVPVAALALAPALAIGLGVVLSLMTGRRASGLRPAAVLRAE